MAERLASHGIALAAPEHEGNTLFDRHDDKLMGLNEETTAFFASHLQDSEPAKAFRSQPPVQSGVAVESHP